MLKAILLDLDNTMALFDEPGFYKRYFKRIAPYFSDLFPAGDFLKRMIRATQDLKENDGRLSNQEHFMATLARGAAEDQRGRIWRRFVKFYQEEYDRIERDVTAPPGLQETLDRLVARKLKLVLASNPIFPRSVHQKRAAWVGIDPAFPWDLVTHIANMRYVKPRSGYFRQISAMLGIPPEQCLMVGNDPINDMAAGRTGMKTYLTTDGKRVDYASLQMTVDREHPPAPIQPDFSGKFREITRVIARLADA